MKNCLLIFAILVVGINGVRISEEENTALQESCGRKHGYQRKVINGEFAQRGEFPWAASVYVRHLNQTTNTYKAVIGPGTIISPRHIVAYNTVSMGSNGKLSILGIENTEYEGICEGSHLVVPEEMNPRFDFGFDHYTKFDDHNFEDSVAKVTIFNGCNSSNVEKLLVLELIDNLDLGSRIRQAACVSNSRKNWFQPDDFSVYGMNRAGILVSGKFAPVNCTVETPYSCATAVDKNQGLCQGDFGGSAVGNLEDRFTLLGLYYSGNTRCAAKTARIADYKFVNIGDMREEFCEMTGVCAPAPEEEEAFTREPEGETTTEDDTAYTREPEEETTTEDDTAYTREPEEETTTEDDTAYTREPEAETTTEDDTAYTREPEEETTDQTIYVPQTEEPEVTEEPEFTEGPDFTEVPEENTTTAIPDEITPPPRIGKEGEVIVAETFEPHQIVQNCTAHRDTEGHETITAETFEPMPLGTGAHRHTGPHETITAERYEPMAIGPHHHGDSDEAITSETFDSMALGEHHHVDSEGHEVINAETYDSLALGGSGAGKTRGHRVNTININLYF